MQILFPFAWIFGDPNIVIRFHKFIAVKGREGQEPGPRVSSKES